MTKKKIAKFVRITKNSNWSPIPYHINIPYNIYYIIYIFINSRSRYPTPTNFENIRFQPVFLIFSWSNKVEGPKWSNDMILEAYYTSTENQKNCGWNGLFSKFVGGWRYLVIPTLIDIRYGIIGPMYVLYVLVYVWGTTPPTDDGQ